ncbi:MAG: hypothetical protein HZA81_02275 [Candidatus Taylorbacteria bacterium]|nr:hypothetical protein [Candidatus Taylorbacteria bacterium]
MNTSLLTDIAYYGGLLSALFLVRYAAQIWFGKAPPTGQTSFLMWTILDVLLVVNTIRVGKPILLPLGWTVGAFLVFLTLRIRGKWEWTKEDTIAASAAAIAALVSLSFGGRIGLIASIAAMTSAGIPVLLQNLKNPVRATFPLWFVTVLSCIFTLLASDRSFDGTVLAWSSLTFNGTMSIIVMLPPRPQAAPAAT